MNQDRGRGGMGGGTPGEGDGLRLVRRGALAAATPDHGGAGGPRDGDAGGRGAHRPTGLGGDRRGWEEDKEMAAMYGVGIERLRPRGTILCHHATPQGGKPLREPKNKR